MVMCPCIWPPAGHVTMPCMVPDSVLYPGPAAGGRPHALQLNPTTLQPYNPAPTAAKPYNPTTLQPCSYCS